MIFQKNKCVNNCKKDNEYLYEYNNSCLNECPKDKKIDIKDKICLESCKENQFEFDNICYNEIPIEKFGENGTIYIKNITNIDFLLKKTILSENLFEERNNFIIETDNDFVYEITTSKNELDSLKKYN